MAIVVRVGSRVSVRGAVGWCCPERLRSNSSARPQLRGRKRSASPISIPGYQCFDWNIKLERLGPQLEPQPRKRPKRKTRTQREEANRVREKGACLRCYVQKLKVYNIHLSIWILLMQFSALKGFLVYLVQSYSARLRRLSEQERCSGQHV